MSLKQLVVNISPEKKFCPDMGHIRDKAAFRHALITVMNTSGVATGRGTHYNSRDEEMEARRNAGKALFEMDRGVFMLVHTLSGVTDDARKTAVKALLMNNWERYNASCLPMAVENSGVQYLTRSIQANRALNLFTELRKDRVNNTRTKKRLILPYLLNHAKLEWWAVKYRRKLRLALEHAWDKRSTSVIRAIIGKERTPQEDAGLKAKIDAYLQTGTSQEYVYECVSFILGNDGPFTLPLFRAFEAAKTDIRAGNLLPPEVLEGIRSTCFRDKVAHRDILELTRNTSMTVKNRSQMQRKARELQVEITFNPMSRTAVELYILAYADGMTPEIREVLIKKGRQGAAQLPIRFGKVGIVIDDSFSMSGSDTQKLRPMAVALAMKDVLVNTGASFVLRTASGRRINMKEKMIPRPVGRTDLAMALVATLEEGADTVFIISDGYENAPSGRINEVMNLLERIGNRTPVFHINPVIAGESADGVKALSDRIPVLPVSNPQALTLMLIRALIEVDIDKGIAALAGYALPKIVQDGQLPDMRKEVTADAEHH